MIEILNTIGLIVLMLVAVSLGVYCLETLIKNAALEALREFEREKGSK